MRDSEWKRSSIFGQSYHASKMSTGEYSESSHKKALWLLSYFFPRAAIAARCDQPMASFAVGQRMSGGAERVISSSRDPMATWALRNSSGASRSAPAVFAIWKAARACTTHACTPTDVVGTIAEYSYSPPSIEMLLRRTSVLGVCVRVASAE